MFNVRSIITRCDWDEVERCNINIMIDGVVLKTYLSKDSPNRTVQFEYPPDGTYFVLLDMIKQIE